MNSELRNKALILRKNGASYGEIKSKLGVSKSTLSYWLKDFPLSAKRSLELRRASWSKGEASREKYRETMRGKKAKRAQLVYDEYIRRFSKISEESMFVAGLMLYLGEGAKKKDSTVAIANTDVGVIKFFMKWLEKYLGVEREEFRIQLHLYENMDLEREKRFWLESLSLKNNQLYKLSVRKMKKASFTYRESFRHGTCSLYAFGVERVMNVMMAMKAFVDTVNKNK